MQLATGKNAGFGLHSCWANFRQIKNQLRRHKGRSFVGSNMAGFQTQAQGGMAGEGRVGRWLTQAGMGKYCEQFAGLSEAVFRGLLMQVRLKCSAQYVSGGGDFNVRLLCAQFEYRVVDQMKSGGLCNISGWGQLCGMKQDPRNVAHLKLGLIS